MPLFCYYLLPVFIEVTKQIAIFVSVTNKNIIMAKKKQEVKLKEPVRIRFKQLANGNYLFRLLYR